MKWTLYVEPNHCFDEEFPTGWSHDAVMKAAQARYAGKVSTVAPAAIGGSDDDDDEPRSSRSSSYSSSSWGESLGTFGVLVGFFGIIGGPYFVLFALGVFTKTANSLVSVIISIFLIKKKVS